MGRYIMLNKFLLSGFLLISSLAVLSPTNAMEMKDEIEEKKSSPPIKTSALETVTLDGGHLGLTGKQLEDCLYVDILVTNIGTFSVSPQKLPNPDLAAFRVVHPFSYFCSAELSGEFKFEFSTLLPENSFMKLCPHVITLKKLQD
jgi:hypothetical protein